jgi:hypothetical protein
MKEVPMLKAIARRILGLDERNLPKPEVKIVERVVYRQSGASTPNPIAGWE